MDKTIRVALYMRVSTDQQAKEGDSIPAQRAALYSYAEEKGYIVVDEYVDEGISGRKFKERDELQRLLDDVKSKKIDQICFTKLDRWYRSIRHYTATQELLDKYGVTWLAIWEPIYDTTTPSGRLIVNQMMSIAQFEAENTGQRIKQVFDYKITKGEVICGSVPPGYSVKDKHLVPNADAPIIRAMFDYYKRTNNLRQTTMFLEREFGFVRNVPKIRDYLRNTIYIGSYRGNEGYCEPIVDKDTFNAVQIALKRNIKQGKRHDYIFTGMIVCAECGKKLAATTKYSYGKHAKYEYAFYSCQGKMADRCKTSVYWGERRIEKTLLEQVIPNLEGKSVEYSIEEKKPKENKAKISALESKIQRTKDLYIAGMMTIDEVTEKVRQYESEIESLKVEPPKVNYDALKKFLSADFKEMYNSLSPSEKRQIWRSVIKEIRVDKDRNVTVSFL